MISTTRANPFLFLVGAIQAMGAGAIYALLAELQDHYGLPTWGLGFIAGGTFATSLIVQLVVPRYADRGSTRLLLQLGVLVGALGMMWFGLASHLWEFVAARALLGLGWGIYMPTARRALVASEPGRSGERLGRLTSVEVAGFVTGPPLAALINESAGLRAPFLIQAGVLLACSPLLKGIREREVEERVERRPLRVLVSRADVRATLAMGAAIYLSFGVFEAVWARYMTDHGASTKVIAMTLSLFPLPLIFLAPRGGRIADRAGPMRMALVALWATAMIQVLFGVVDALWLVIGVAVVDAVVGAVSMPATQAAVIQAAPAALVAASQGLYGAVGAACAALGSIAAAGIYDSVGGSVMWFAMATATGALAALAGFWSHRGSSLRPNGAVT